ncbi:MAG TPA: hypothetical protein VGP33_07630, partial [Chloroflexota bacterium]|nr:hypothetical protein [Chloroflexota bacterium]
VPSADDDAILQAPAIVVAAGFERNPIAAATVPDDLRRRWERTLVKLRPISSKAQGMCNSAQLLGIDGHTLVLSAKGITFVMDSLNDQRLRSTVEPVIEEIFGQKLGLRCELNGTPLGVPENALATPVNAVPDAGAAPKGPATKRPPTVSEPQPAVIPPDPATVPPARDLAAEAGNNMTVRMAMDAFGARIESVIPVEDSRRAG